MGKRRVCDGQSVFSFGVLGIPVGSVLHYVRDPSVTVKVCGISRKDIKYNGEWWSLSALAQHLLKVSYGVRGTKFFTYNGELLSDMWDRAVEESTKNRVPIPN